MTRKRRRLVVVAAAMCCLAAAVGLVLSAFEENLVFFFSPSDLMAKEVAPGQRLRVGGLVEEASVQKMDDGLTIAFNVTDLANSVPVTYSGLLPALFREGQGVIAEGHIGTDGVFVADEILAKHDENYMPPEVAEALKDAGHWQGGAE